MEPLRTPDEVAAYLHVPTKTLAQWRYKRTGPTYQRVGRVIRYRIADVDAWLEKQTHRAS